VKLQRSPLHWAVAKSHTEIVSALIAAGADVNPEKDWVSKQGTG
jgi:ankyrin repeat protein